MAKGITIAQGTILKGNAPVAPSSVTATPDSDSITISWSKGARTKTLKVQRSTDNVAWSDLVSGLTGTSHDDTTVVDGVLYYYRVVAVNIFGTATSSVVFATVLADSIMLPVSTGAAVSKAEANTQQWQDFKSWLDTNLSAALTSDYYWNGAYAAASYALGYHCLKISNPSTAKDYAGKALGIILSGIRDDHSLTYAHRQFLARGDGSEDTFQLPFTPIAGTLTVWLYTVDETAVVRGAGDFDHLAVVGGDGSVLPFFIKVSDTASDGPEDYVKGTDWRQGAYTYDRRQDTISWISGTKPSTSSTYYVTRTKYTSAPDIALQTVTTHYTLSGDTITFVTPPPANKAVVVTFRYHKDANVRYQSSGNGLGGVGAVAGFYSDFAYPIRYWHSLALAFDLIYGWADFPSGDKTEIAQAFVDGFDALDAVEASFPTGTGAGTNYGVGWLIARGFLAAAVQDGRHADASRLVTELRTVLDTHFFPWYDPIDGDETKRSILGGYTGEGLSSYARETSEHNLKLGALLAQDEQDLLTDDDRQIAAGNLATFAGDLIKFLLHARYTEGGVSYAGDTRPGYAQESGRNQALAWPCPSPNKGVFAIASELTSDANMAAYARHLVENEAGGFSPNWAELLFYNENGTAIDWAPINGGTLGLHYFVPSHGILISRADWNYNSTWVVFHCPVNATFEPSPAYVNVYRGGDKLLVHAGAKGGTDASVLSKAPWQNCVVLDDNGTAQLYRYATSNFGPYSQVASQTQILKLDLQTTYNFISSDYRACYYNGSTYTATTLERDMFYIRPDYVVVFDRIIGTSGYPKHLRWNFDSTTHPVGSGTMVITRTSDSASTSSLAYNASAATVQAALEGLSGIGSGNVTVTKYCDGHYRFIFHSGLSDQGAFTVSYTTGRGEIIRGQRCTRTELHTSAHGGPVAGKFLMNYQYDLILGASLTDDTPISNDVSSSRGWLVVHSDDASLIPNRALVGVNYQTESPGALSPARLVHRCNFHPADATTPATMRYVSGFRSGTTSLAAMDEEHIVGTDGELEGLRIENVVCLFRKGTSFTPPDSFTATYNGTLKWYVSGLSPNTQFDLTGAAVATITANSEGVATFNSTASSTHSITIAEYVPPPSSDPVFDTTFVGDSVLVSGDMNTIFTQESQAAPNGQGGSGWWAWYLGPHCIWSNDYPGIMWGNHISLAIMVGAFYSNNCNTPGGTVSFTRRNATLQEIITNDGPTMANRTMGSSARIKDFGYLGGSLNILDFNGDGRLDSITFSESITVTTKQQEADGTWINGPSFGGAANSTYLDFIGDADGDGDVDLWFNYLHEQPANFESFTRQKATWNGSGWTRSSDFRPIPSGIPTATKDEINAWLTYCHSQGSGPRLFIYRADLDNDGEEDLVVTLLNGYVRELDRSWYLKKVGSDYQDYRATWGLPHEGWCPNLSRTLNNGIGYPQTLESFLCQDGGAIFDFARKSLTAPFGTGVPCLFITGAGFGTHGFYKWNGTSYTRQSTSGITTALSYATEDYGQIVYPCDLDNDGWMDLVILSPRLGRFFVFINKRDGTFTQWVKGAHSGSYFGGNPWCLGVADFNDNGLLDLICIGETGGPTYNSKAIGMLKNNTTDPGRYLKVFIRRSSGSNRFGYGALVQVFQSGGTFTTLLGQWPTELAGLPVHFGLGSHTTVDLKVTWPAGGGSAYTQTGISTNQAITVTS